MSSTCVVTNNQNFHKLQDNHDISKRSLENILKGWLDKGYKEINYESKEFIDYLNDRLCLTKSVYTSKSKYDKAHKAWEIFTKNYETFEENNIKVVRQIASLSFGTNDFIIYETKEGKYTLKIKEPTYQKETKKEVSKVEIYKGNWTRE